MKKIMNTRLALGVACCMGLAFGLAGTAQAIPAAHNNITLKDGSGNDLTFGSNAAFSTKHTCGACHDYASIERHATHAQLGVNQLSGWNPYNPDSAMAEKKNDTSQGKNWVQNSGHVGKW